MVRYGPAALAAPNDWASALPETAATEVAAEAIKKSRRCRWAPMMSPRMNAAQWEGIHYGGLSRNAGRICQLLDVETGPKAKPEHVRLHVGYWEDERNCYKWDQFVAVDPSRTCQISNGPVYRCSTLSGGDDCAEASELLLR